MAKDSIDALVERIERLEAAVFATGKPYQNNTDSNMDWTLNERAFVHRYAKNKSGTAKFVLLVAYIAKGQTDVNVSLDAVQKLWGKMTAASLLGIKFNRKYTSDAKSYGWVDSPTKGVYQLTHGWAEILESTTTEGGE